MRTSRTHTKPVKYLCSIIIIRLITAHTDLRGSLKELEIHDGPDLDLAFDWASAAGVSLSDEIEKITRELVAVGDLEPEALEAFD